MAALGSLGIAFAPTAQAAQTPCDARAKACLQLHTHQAWLMNTGSVTRGPVPVTVGRPGYETPTGTFRVQYKDIDHYSKEFNGPMPYSVFFTSTGVAFHEGSLRVQSHGCVHLSHADAVAFFQTLHPGDVVEVKS
ncbi:MAG TPA: L,D-transpeptidase [Amycolatopsis sp.]|uniref:L,D-transpeptidase n=1 Tax=Amycolatopsis sp. TaxID=37632 RepID=UPI002B487E91|nr:L,D-transpeptidase [Amycolatopsis sp.]HKS45555.1 L,D-transpeptidase [Amycolatopsis sp.]